MSGVENLGSIPIAKAAPLPQVVYGEVGSHQPNHFFKPISFFQLNSFFQISWGLALARPGGLKK